MSKPKEYWVPEDFVYMSASECMLSHPEQAAQLMRDDSVKRAADKLAEAVNKFIHWPDYIEKDSDNLIGLAKSLEKALAEYRDKK